ncbi:hypothetical protein L7F22_038794 [Adiantum nelumboides]|nr:hypothetical protein [Adiantum nelumboides]
MKSKDETFSCFKKFLSSVKTQSEHKLKALCSDNGGEFVSKVFADFCSSRGIKHEFTAPYTPAQNGVAEQMNRTIQERIMSMLAQDSLSVYACIAKSKANEAWVEEKCKRDEEAIGTSKRATRSSTKKEEVSKPSPEVNMEDAPKDKKQGKPRGLSYKLKSDIELTTDLKKVFEERILNSKVEMALGDILGIIKHEFHEEIIDIIKRKW